MEYSTEFKGTLKFLKDLPASQLTELDKYLGEDCRDHPEWCAGDLTFIDIELTPDYTGLQWDGAEPCYDMPQKVNLIIDEMQKKFPDFGLEGKFTAQGQEVNDRWTLRIVDGRAERYSIKVDDLGGLVNALAQTFTKVYGKGGQDKVDEWRKEEAKKLLKTYFNLHLPK